MLELSREENLQRRSHPLRLQLAPQPTLVAPDAVHDASDVEELLAELKLQFAGIAVEHFRLVEVRWERLDDVQQILHSQLNFLVVLVEAGVELLVAQQRRNLRDRPQLDDVREVKVSQPVLALPARRLGAEARLELLQVRSPHAVRRCEIDGGILLRLEVVRAEVNVDGRVQSRHHPVEHALLQAGIAQRVVVDE